MLPHLLPAVSDGGVRHKAILLAKESLSDLIPASSRDFLGTETDLLIIDAWQHQQLNEWVAAVDCIKAGAVLLLLCPPLADWSGRFSSRLGQQLLADQTVSLIQQGLPARFAEFEKTTDQTWRQALPSPDQRRCIAAIIRCANGRNKRPLVIRADRGRGKTSALGLAAAELIRQGKRVIITALHREAVATAFARVGEALSSASAVDDGLEDAAGRLVFMPVQQLLDEPVACDLLLVDEAAMLSVALLQQLLEYYPRVVFATTVHGYEGSGRGFDIRFRAVLDRLRPQWRRAYLAQPIRWSRSDPLELSLRALFLLDTCSVEKTDSDPPQFAAPLSVEVIASEQLLVDEGLLRQVFALLVDAHYQTTPQDLQQLLDLPQTLVVARAGADVVGVCQCFPEGQLAEALIEPVIAAKRRPPGNLVAQRLALRYAEAEFLRSSSLRVSRIAVDGRWRRRGIGRALLTKLELQALRQGVGFLSCSFAVEPGVLQFWQRQGFSSLYLGSRRDASSGSHSLIVVKALKEQWRSRHQDLAAIFQRDLPLQVVDYPGLEAGSLSQLITESGTASVASDSMDWHNALRFSRTELSLVQARPSLWRLACQPCAQGIDDGELVLASLLLQRPLAQLIRDYHCEGNAGFERRLRTFFATLCQQAHSQ